MDQRLLEDGSVRLLEDGFDRLLEGGSVVPAQTDEIRRLTGRLDV